MASWLAFHTPVRSAGPPFGEKSTTILAPVSGGGSISNVATKGPQGLSVLPSQAAPSPPAASAPYTAPVMPLVSMLLAQLGWLGSLWGAWMGMVKELENTKGVRSWWKENKWLECSQPPTACKWWIAWHKLVRWLGFDDIDGGWWILMILMVAGEFLDYLKLPAKTVGSVAMATVASVDTPTSRIILGWAEI
jgi:hypothetical protein